MTYMKTIFKKKCLITAINFKVITFQKIIREIFFITDIHLGGTFCGSIFSLVQFFFPLF